MKYVSLLLALTIPLHSCMDAMYCQDEIKLEIVNKTARIVSAFDQQEEYHDLFPQVNKEFSLSADHHRSYKICAPAITYTIFFLKRHRAKPIVQLCRREIGADYYGPKPENNPIYEIEAAHSRTIIATITPEGQVILDGK